MAMTALVAPHHPALWQQRRASEQAMHMGMSGYLPGSTAPSSHRPYQPTAAHIDLSIPHFGHQLHNIQLPFASPYGFDALSVSPYAVQQHHIPPIYHPPTTTTTTTTTTTLSPSGPYSHPTHLTSALPHVREARNSVSGLAHSLPPVKLESNSPAQPSRVFIDASAAMEEYGNAGCCSNPDSQPVTFNTDVDELMRAIQAKSGKPAPRPQAQPASTVPPPAFPLALSTPVDCKKTTTTPKTRKRHLCTVSNCNKSFYQKTHLDIHIRAHTGQKPFVCKYPACGQRFSQLGNLKTHERRHTGERPYLCDVCGKSFAQRGNVRAHKIVHEQTKPFVCRLDACGKQFTQLGNLKSHQNKFHAESIRQLTSKFAGIRDGDSVTQHDKELWEYFAALYKNSNKGIKGRGKDRRISSAPSPTATAAGFRAQRVTPPSSAFPPPLLQQQCVVGLAHVQSAPVSPVGGASCGGVAKRGARSVQLTRGYSRGSSASSGEDGMGVEQLGHQGQMQQQQHQHHAAFGFEAVGMDVVFAAAAAERKMF